MLLKKSLTHAGVLISLIILVVLLLLNWNKCFVNPLEKWLRPTPQKDSARKEEFQADINTAVNKGVDARDITVDLNPATRQVKVGFTGLFGSDIPVDHVVRGYLLVMAKYDRDLNKVGTLDVKLTEESGGQTLATDLKTYTGKYSGVLVQGRADMINGLRASNATAQSVLKAFLPSSSPAQPILANLNDLPTQEIGMFFELLGLIYKYQMKEPTNKLLKTIYDELRIIFGMLPPANQTPTPPGDPNYDYLQIVTLATDKNKQAANDLTKAMKNYSVLRTILNPSGDVASQPKKIVVDAFRDWLQELLKRILAGEEEMVSNVCSPDTKKCSYTFTQVEPVDPQGNIYYYKLGVGVIFINNTTGAEKLSKIKAYTFGQGNKLQYFRVDTNLDDQERLLKRLEELERLNSQRALQQQQMENDDEQIAGRSQSVAGSGINLYLDMLRPYLGNYPNEYLLGTEQGRELTLDKYFNESLAAGQINIMADFSGLTPSTTAAANPL